MPFPHVTLVVPRQEIFMIKNTQYSSSDDKLRIPGRIDIEGRRLGDNARYNNEEITHVPMRQVLALR